MSTTQQDQLKTFLIEVLQISEEQFPPNYYELLGIDTFESDEAKIKQQASRQVQLIRKQMSPENERIAKIAVHNIGKAKTCLLDASARQAYELKLGSSRKPKLPAKPQKPRDPGPAEYRLSPPENLPRPSKRQLAAHSPSSKPLPSVSLASPAARPGNQSGGSPQLIYIGVGGGVVLLLAVIAIVVVMTRSPGPAVEKANAVETVDAGSPSQPSSATPPPPPLVKDTPDEATESEEKNTEDEAQPAPVQPPPPEPQRADNFRDPFELLPIAVVLPPIEQVRTELVDQEKAKAAVKLGELHEDSLEELVLEIDRAAASLPADREFRLVAVENSEHDNEWHCGLARTAAAVANAGSALGDTGEDASLVIARIYRDGGLLFFEWSNLATPAVGGQLRNAKLACLSGEHRHDMRLRPIQVQEPHLLDFTEANQTIALIGESFPSKDSLFLEFVALDGFSGNLEQVPEEGTSSVGDMIRLRPDGWDDAEIRLKLRVNSEQPELVISAFAELGERWRPITTELIRDKLADLQKTLEKNQQKLNRTRQLQSKQAQQRQRVASTSTRNPTEESAKRVELRRIDKLLKSYGGTIERLSGAIPKTREQIQRLEMLAKVGNRIHQTVRLRLRVYAITETGEFDLLHLGRVLNAGQQRL